MNTIAEAFARAAHVTRLDTWINRVTGVPMEPRAAVGVYDADNQRYTLYAGSGGIVRQQKEIAAILGVPFESVRVVGRDHPGRHHPRQHHPGQHHPGHDEPAGRRRRLVLSRRLLEWPEVLE